MPTQLSCLHRGLCGGLLAFAILQSACGNLKKVEGQSPARPETVQPALFTVPPDQMAHLKVCLLYTSRCV